MERERGENNRCPRYGKIQWEDEALARAMAKRIRKRFGPKLKAYECVYCHFWHIGHDRPPKRRAGTLVRTKPPRKTVDKKRRKKL